MKKQVDASSYTTSRDTTNLTRDPIGEKHMIERAFGVGAGVITEAMTLIEEHFKAVA
ncbi:MAG TPA: hypothetical protein VJ942_01585 [Roseovarius sp.]|nr:hypothetical protein [Roseovarius sp.]